MLRKWMGKVGRLLIGNHSVPPFSKGGLGGFRTRNESKIPPAPLFQRGEMLADAAVTGWVERL
jgi:hypothetical protein